MKRMMRFTLSLALLMAHASNVHAYVSFGDVRAMHPDGGANSRPDVAVDLATDGAGHWVAVTTGPYVSTSSDNGDTWTNPVLLPGGLYGSMFWAHESNVVTDGLGTWLISWIFDDDTPGVDSEVMVSRSSDNGATWSLPMLIASDAATSSGYNNRPRLAADGTGRWMATWHTADPVNGDDDIRFTTSSDNGFTWAPVAWLMATAPLDTINQNWPDVATDGHGHWVISYNEFGIAAVDWRIKTRQSADFGVTWASPLTHGMTLGLGVSDLDSDGSSGFVVAHAGLQTIVSVSSDGGASFGGTPAVSRLYGSEQGRSRIATDGDGEWVAIWDTDSDPYLIGGSDRDVVFADSTDHADSWSVANYVDHRDANLDDNINDGWPDIATDGAGRWIAAWQRPFNDSLDIVMAISDRPCPTTRRTDCITGESGKSSFSIADDQDSVIKDKLKLKIGKAGLTAIADFGDPTTADDLVLCVWDSTAGNDRLAYWSTARAAGTCDGAPCWSSTSKGFSYSDKFAEHSAFSKAKLAAGEAGKAGVALQGSGVGLRPPTLPFDNDTSLAVQVLSGATGKCWGATFSTPKVNTSTKYSAKSD